MQNLRGKRIVVVGAGMSGIAAANFCHDRGAEVVLSDRREQAEIDRLSELSTGIELDCGGHSADMFRHADLVVVSPGIPLDIPVLKHAQQAGVKICGEVELASWFIQAPVIGITGTNGKSTVTSLVGAMLHHCGEHVFVGGNIGTPLIDAASGSYSVVVAELSSFQLETVERLHAAVAVLLNISPDHLDRYANMDEYMRAKRSIFSNQTSSDLMVLNQADPNVVALAEGGRGQAVFFSTAAAAKAAFEWHPPFIVVHTPTQELRFDTAELELRGIHNVENVMAAMAACLHFGHDPAQLWQAACEFKGLPHRMELVRTLHGVAWYNDSKGTNIGSMEKSLNGIDTPVTLIAGGKDKGGDYAILRPLLERKRPKLVLLGEAAPKMVEAWSDLCEISVVESMQQAVAHAYTITSAPGSVLLSPGCSSFDMFSSFAQRGDVFADLVRTLE